MDDSIEQMMAGFAQQRRRLEKLKEELRRTTASSTSADHLMTAVVGVGGEVKDITFHRTDYAALAPAALSKALMDVLDDARRKATARADELVGPVSGLGVQARESLAGSPELEELLGLITQQDRPTVIEEGLDG